MGFEALALMAGGLRGLWGRCYERAVARPLRGRRCIPDWHRRRHRRCHRRWDSAGRRRRQRHPRHGRSAVHARAVGRHSIGKGVGGCKGIVHLQDRRLQRVVRWTHRKRAARAVAPLGRVAPPRRQGSPSPRGRASSVGGIEREVEEGGRLHDEVVVAGVGAGCAHGRPRRRRTAEAGHHLPVRQSRGHSRRAYVVRGRTAHGHGRTGAARLGGGARGEEGCGDAVAARFREARLAPAADGAPGAAAAGRHGPDPAAAATAGCGAVGCDGDLADGHARVYPEDPVAPHRLAAHGSEGQRAAVPAEDGLDGGVRLRVRVARGRHQGAARDAEADETAANPLGAERHPPLAPDRRGRLRLEDDQPGQRAAGRVVDDAVLGPMEQLGMRGPETALGGVDERLMEALGHPADTGRRQEERPALAAAKAAELVLPER